MPREPSGVYVDLAFVCRPATRGLDFVFFLFFPTALGQNTSDFHLLQKPRDIETRETDTHIQTQNTHLQCQPRTVQAEHALLVEIT